jgi:hypothetical protein
VTDPRLASRAPSERPWKSFDEEDGHGTRFGLRDASGATVATFVRSRDRDHVREVVNQDWLDGQNDRTREVLRRIREAANEARGDSASQTGNVGTSPQVPTDRVERRPTVLLINGPPRAGKDTVGQIVAKYARGRVYVAKMAKALKERTHALYDLRFRGPSAPFDQLGEPYPHDWFESSKDQPSPDFLGLTPRQAYIAVSERLLKPMHGPRVFGELLVQDLERNARDADLIVVTDSGFADEALPIIERFGADRVHLIRVRRPGHTFEGDSRSFIELPGIRTLDLQNMGSLEMLEAGVEQALWECGLTPTKAETRRSLETSAQMPNCREFGRDAERPSVTFHGQETRHGHEKPSHA